MPAIRFPASAVPLLHLCKGHGESFIFRTYADIISFLSAYGFQLVVHEGQKAIPKPHFVSIPNPIDLEVFVNRGLYSNFLIMALAHPDGLERTENELIVVEMVEIYAATGAEHLGINLREKEGATALNIITEVLLGGSKILI